MSQLSREKILDKLRGVRRPFGDAPPRPDAYLPVSPLDENQNLLERFQQELDALNAELFVVDGDEAARSKVLELLEDHETKRILSWDFAHIPVDGLQAAIKESGYAIEYPRIHDDDRAEAIDRMESAEVGLTGADAAAATTGTLIVSTGEGKARIPTVLPPNHIVVITLDQLLPRIEDWLKQEREHDDQHINSSANLCFISGPSRTADIEKKLVLGVHGPRRVQVIVKR